MKSKYFKYLIGYCHIYGWIMEYGYIEISLKSYTDSILGFLAGNSHVVGLSTHLRLHHSLAAKVTYLKMEKMVFIFGKYFACLR